MNLRLSHICISALLLATSLQVSAQKQKAKSEVAVPDFAAADVKGIAEGTQLKETAQYSISCTRISSQQKGINIVRLSDGRTVKVVVR